MLGEGLASLELRELSRRTEARDTALAHRIGSPGDERNLGPDHDEIGLDLIGEITDRLRIRDVDGHDIDLARDAGIAGRADDRRDGVIREKRSDESVLASTGADDQDLHGTSLATVHRHRFERVVHRSVFEIPSTLTDSYVRRVPL